MSDVNPIRPNSTPMLNAGAAGAEGLRNQYDQRGNRGGKGKDDKKKDEPKDEPEAAPEEAAEEQGHLETDTFSGRKARNVMNNLFADALPWEQEEAEKAAKLEELKRKREALTNRGGAAAGAPAPRTGTGALPRKPGAIPPPPHGRPGTGSLGGVKVPPPPAEVPTPAPGVPLGRRVDENFDPTAALNSTLLAHQELQARQAQREREDRERREAEANALDAPGLAKFLRPAPGARSPSGRLPEPVAGPADDGGMLTAPLRPEIEIAPLGEARGAAPDAAKRAMGQPAVRPPSIDDLAGQAAPAAAPRTPTGKLPARPAMAARPGSGALDPAQAAGQPRPAARPPAEPPAGARPASGRAGAAGARDAAAPRGEAPAVRPKPITRPEPIVRPEAPASAEAVAPPAPSWTTPTPPLEALEAVVPAAGDLLVPFPTDEEDEVTVRLEAGLDRLKAESGSAFGGAKPPPVKAGQVSAACVYRVIDVATNKPMGGARVELEPTHDDLLPNIHGQANAEGWYTAEGLPPGEYRVTVRAPGYVPAFKVRLLDVGMVDDLAIFIAKP